MDGEVGLRGVVVIGCARDDGEGVAFLGEGAGDGGADVGAVAEDDGDFGGHGLNEMKMIALRWKDGRADNLIYRGVVLLSCC